MRITNRRGIYDETSPAKAGLCVFEQGFSPPEGDWADVVL
jgi:hypothetical protein